MLSCLMVGHTFHDVCERHPCLHNYRAGAWLECMGGAVGCVTMHTRGEADINQSNWEWLSSADSWHNLGCVHGVLLVVGAS